MSFFKKAAVGLATVFCLASAPASAQYGQPYNPYTDPMSPINPLSPTNPNGIYYTNQDDGPTGPMTTTDKWIVGITGALVLAAAGLMVWEGTDVGDNIRAWNRRRKEQKNAPKS